MAEQFRINWSARRVETIREKDLGCERGDDPFRGRRWDNEEEALTALIDAIEVEISTRLVALRHAHTRLSALIASRHRKRREADPAEDTSHEQQNKSIEIS